MSGRGRRAAARLIATSAFAVAAAEAAFALEYCVTCEDPAALYRCVIEGTDAGPGKDPSISLYCISEMAKRGGHAACAVSRGAPYPCPGLTATVPAPKDLPTLAAPPPGAPPAGVAPPAAPAAGSPPPAAADVPPEPESEAKSAKVPRTVEELATETVRSSTQGLKKAGEAIGGTAKKAGEQIGSAGSAIGSAATKTWSCIASLFSNCGGEPDGESAAAPGTGAPPPKRPASAE